MPNPATEDPGQAAPKAGTQVQQQLGALAASSTHWSTWGEPEWALILLREDELRLSPETQAAYAAAEAHTSSIDWLEVTDGLQTRVLLEAGVPRNQLTAALSAMRSAPYRHPSLKPLCIYHRHQRVFEGPPVGTHIPPDLKLARPQDPTHRVRLLDCFTSPRHNLLVLFAGSYSWPPFRAMVEPMAALAERNGDVASFAIVYVAEAHAEDEWPIKSSRYNGSRGPVLIRQHKTTAERCAAAAAFAADFGIQVQVLVDPMPGEEEGRKPVAAAAATAAASTVAATAAEVADEQHTAAHASADACEAPAAVQQQQQQPQGGPAAAKPSREAFVLRACTAQQQLDEQQQQQQDGPAGSTFCGPQAAATASCSNGSCGSGRGRIIGYGNSGPFDAALAPWPLRFYVIDRSGCLLFKAEPKDCQYDLFQLWDWLEVQKQKQQLL